MAESTTLEDLGKGLELEVEHVPVDLIDPDPENPNQMDPALFETLSAEIDRGFVQPVLVSPTDDGRYRMIDGEHRWRLVAEKGFATVPAVIERYPDTQEGRDEARIRLLTMNRLRGQFVPIRLAYVLADLAQRIPEADLRKRLGMEAGELTDHLRLASFTDDIGERLREGVERENRDAPTVLSFVIQQQKDAAAIERVVDKLVGDKVDRGQALAKICRSYERAQRG